MKFTAIIVLASLMVSCVSFVSALARPKLGASRIQMTTKMSNGMAANIKTMVGLVVTGLLAVSTPAWGADKFVMRGYFTDITLPNKVKFDTLPKTGKELTFLTFTCPNDGTSRATAVVQGWGGGSSDPKSLSINDLFVVAFHKKNPTLRYFWPLSPDEILQSMNTLGAQDVFSQPCNTKGVNVYKKDSLSPATLSLLKSPFDVWHNQVYDKEFNKLENQDLFVDFTTQGNFKITKDNFGSWAVENYK